MRFDIESGASQSQLDQLLAVTERYCVVFQTLQNGPKTGVQLNIVHH